MYRMYHIIDYPRFCFEFFRPEELDELDANWADYDSGSGFPFVIKRLIREKIPVVYKLRGKWYVFDGGFFKLTDYCLLTKLFDGD